MLLELELTTFCRVVVVFSLCFCKFSRIDDISGPELVTASEISGICELKTNTNEIKSTMDV